LDIAARDPRPAPTTVLSPHAIAAETLRRLGDLDALIDGATRNRCRTMPRRASLCASHWFRRLPSILPLTRPSRPYCRWSTAGPRKLVHGVFGTLMRQGAALPELPSLPAAVEARWARNWGEGVAAEAARLLASPPPLDLVFAAGAEPPPEMEGLSLMAGHLRLPGRTAVAGLTGYGEGGWWVQDIAASLPARLMGAGGGRSALDLCAAPGGKTMQLASAGFAVTAVDASESRLARLSENLARTSLSAKVIAADILRWSPPDKVDAILLDAPCSATGIFRRHPDVLHRVRPRAIAELAAGQKAMLARAAGWLKPGGTLVYSVCSLEPEEGEAVVEAFLAERRDFEAAHILPGELPERIPFEGNRIRILPGLFGEEGGADGFFIARFRRV
jgi:16S rRNA (cytosine967-C5)-methyltransferase